MNNNYNVSTLSKALHAILFIGLFFFIRNENGSISWIYTILGLLTLLFSLKTMEHACCKYNVLSKSKTFFTITVPSCFIYLGLYLLAQSMFNLAEISIIFAASVLMAFFLSLINEKKYMMRDHIRTDKYLLRKSITSKGIDSLYQCKYYCLKSKIAEKVATNQYKSFNIKASTAIFLTVVIIITVSMLIDIVGVNEVIFNMVVYSYIIPSLFITLPLTALFNLVFLNEISKKYSEQRAEELLWG